MSALPLAVSMQPGDQSAFMLACRKSDAVIVTSVEEADAMLTDCAAEAVRFSSRGKCVLMADPFALTTDQRNALAASESVMPMYTRRQNPAIQHISDQLDSGVLGSPGLLRIHDWIPDSVNGEVRLPGWLDIAGRIFGDRPDTVCAVSRNECQQIHLGYARGGMAIVTVDQLIGSSGYFSCSLIGSLGAASIDDHHNAQMLFGSADVTALRSGTMTPQLNSVLTEFAAFATLRPDISERWIEVESLVSVYGTVRESAVTRAVIRRSTRSD